MSNDEARRNDEIRMPKTYVAFAARSKETASYKLAPRNYSFELLSSFVIGASSFRAKTFQRSQTGSMHHSRFLGTTCSGAQNYLASRFAREISMTAR
jgi:hypothetical protein